jgi:pyruvate/2-oxoglutarate dehydrogenase complex dihydrolipoamide dehydrogenase (E3) component
MSCRRGKVTIGLKQVSPLVQTLGCKTNKSGEVEIDSFRPTNVEAVYASGDSPLSTPSQLRLVASKGSKVVMGVGKGLMVKIFKRYIVDY